MAVVFRFFTYVFAMLLLAAVGAVGAGALQADLLPLAMQPRSGAPALFDVRLGHRGAGLVEGRLEITLRQSDQVMLRWTTQELALAGGGMQTLRLLTPPLPPRYGGQPLEATLRLLTARGAIELGAMPFAPQAEPSERRIIVAVCGAREAQATAPDEEPAWRRLRPESLREALGRSKLEAMATAPIFFEPEDFPTDPLVGCAFDLVILRENAIDRLRPRAAEALVRWLEGGGAVALLGASAHSDALPRLLAAGRGGPAIEAKGPGEAGVFRAYVGLGRCAVWGAAADQAAEETWVRAADFLWNGMREGARVSPLMPRSRSASRWRADEDVAGSFKVLLPENMKLLPPWQIFGLLALLVALIGPIDWLVLGRLRARRWTWLLFPLAVAATTAATLLLADRSLGQSAHRGVVTVKDLGPDGRVHRTHRFALTLAPRSRTAAEPLAAVLASLFPPMRADSGRAPSLDDRALSYRGQFPARYEIERTFEQWTPSILRTLELGGEDDSGLPWSLAEPTAIRLRAAAPAWQMLVMQRGQERLQSSAGILAAGFLKRPIAIAADASAREAVSPSGSAWCEDLGIGDRHDPRQWVVIAVRRFGPDFKIYRHLFFAGERRVAVP